MSEKKSIYELDMKEMRKIITQFGGTLYGKTMFFLSYFVSIVTFLVMLCLGVNCIIAPSLALICAVAIAFGVFLISFILGNICYYKEIRIFSEKNH